MPRAGTLGHHQVYGQGDNGFGAPALSVASAVFGRLQRIRGRRSVRPVWRAPPFQRCWLTGIDSLNLAEVSGTLASRSTATLGQCPSAAPPEPASHREQHSPSDHELHRSADGAGPDGNHAGPTPARHHHRSGRVRKTRLALEVARRLTGRFEDGVWLVQLDNLEDAQLVSTAIAMVLGVREHPGLSVAESVSKVAGPRHMLLLLDNCEHVIDAAAEAAERLLLAGDDLRILATSREPLGLPGEARLRLPALSLPSPHVDVWEEGHCESVELFLARAALSNPDFTLDEASYPAVESLMQRLDGLPLAIELAAARLDVLGLPQLVAGVGERYANLVDRSRRVSKRQRSLQATVDWSIRLLEPAEERAFRRLSVFPAPFSIDAAQAVVGRDATELVESLVRRSLVTPPRPGADGRYRYGMLETLRSSGSGLLDESDDGLERIEALVGWAVHEAVEVSAGFDGPDDSEAGLWFDAETHNLLEALEWALANQPGVAVRLALAMSPWWLLRGQLGEGRTYLARALQAEPAAPAEVTASAHAWMGWMCCDSGHFTTMIGHMEQAANLWRASKYVARHRRAQRADHALLDLGRSAEAMGAGVGRPWIRLVPSGMRRGGSTRGALADIGLATGDFPGARAYSQEAEASDRSQVAGQSGALRGDGSRRRPRGDWPTRRGRAPGVRAHFEPLPIRPDGRAA